MPFALFALAMINVAVGTQGFAFAGVLSDIAKDLGISIGQAGFIVGASSITFAIGAPLAAALVAQVERRRVILVSLVALTAINALCAVAATYPELVLLRVAAGIATAFTGALATVAAAALVPPEMRGCALRNPVRQHWAVPTWNRNRHCTSVLQRKQSLIDASGLS